jgi:hypothetical protein
MEAARSSEMFVSYITTSRHNPEEHISPWRWKKQGPPKRSYHGRRYHNPQDLDLSLHLAKTLNLIWEEITSSNDKINLDV